MRTRTAVALATIVVSFKAVLIGVVARGRCELIGRCGDGTAFYAGCGMAALLLTVILIVTIADARREAFTRRR